MRELQLLIKPAGAACNLNCSYCFYKDVAGHREGGSDHIMSAGIRDVLIEKALSCAKERCVFGFQGGEPTLAGLPWFREFVKSAEEKRRPGQRIFYTIQTNGTLFTGEWMEFLKKHRFLVGLSLDGTRELHDRNRKDSQEKGTFDAVSRTAKELQKSEIPFHILTVLTRQSAKRVGAIYRFYREEGFWDQQYIPCLEPLGEKPGAHPASLRSRDYAYVLKELFDLWFLDVQQGRRIFIRQFDNWMHVLSGGQPEACTMYGRCSMQNVVEADGEVYPCDFYALDEYRMGNISDTDFEALAELSLKPEEAPFFKDASLRDERCPDCRYYPLCRGGCRRDMFVEEGRSRHIYCEAFREFFDYAIQRMEWLLQTQIWPIRA